MLDEEEGIRENGKCLLFLLFPCGGCCFWVTTDWLPTHSQVKETFRHCFTGYMHKIFPRPYWGSPYHTICWCHGSLQPLSALPYYIFLVKNPTHMFLVGSLCLLSNHLQWRINKMTQNWLFSVMSQEILHPNCGCMNISTIDLCCLSCFSLPPQLGCGAEGKDTCLGRCLSGKEIQLFLFAGSPGLYVWFS